MARSKRSSKSSKKGGNIGGKVLAVSIAGVLFVVLSLKETYKLTNQVPIVNLSMKSATGKLLTSGSPTWQGNVVHGVVFALLLLLIMEL
jgi:hypothetical protein